MSVNTAQTGGATITLYLCGFFSLLIYNLPCNDRFCHTTTHHGPGGTYLKVLLNCFWMGFLLFLPAYMQSPGGIMVVRSVDVTGALRETQTGFRSLTAAQTLHKSAHVEGIHRLSLCSGPNPFNHTRGA